MKPYRTGLVVGKFYPPHKGHNYLIETAHASTDNLFVLVCWKEEHSIPGELRVFWLKEMHPYAHVISVEDTLSDDDSLGWAQNTLKILGFVPDAVFSSEDYGEPYARAMGSLHILVDKNRTHISCSGTMIRNNPLQHLDFLAPCVRAHFVKRICLVGAESTGKTTLSRKLAEHYNTVWMQEYGREYSERKMSLTGSEEWASDEFFTIAHEHAKGEDLLAQKADKVLICDTDAFATGIWHQRYMGFRSGKVDTLAASRKNLYDLYILTDIDIPFVQDGLRDGEHIREWMHNQFIEELKNTDRPFILISGSLERRIQESTKLIDQILKG